MEGEPVSWFVIEPGWRVVDREGEEVGRVEETIGDSDRDIFNGLAVSKGMLAAPRYVPAERVAEITEGCVRLDVSTDELERLEKSEGAPPSAEIRPG